MAAVKTKKTTNSDRLEAQLKEQRRKVDFDTFDVQLQQLLQQIDEHTIDVAPAYQRQYRWDDVRASQLIESLLLGIPIPSLFMATNEDGTWELVDGLQRLTAVAKFAGTPELQQKMWLDSPLKLQGLEKLTRYNDLYFAELPVAIRLQFIRRSFKIVTLSDKSDRHVRFDLFERLNRGGINLSAQEIRHCVFRGKFADTLEELAADKNFKRVVKLAKNQQKDATPEECVLRFFAFLHHYKEFEHLVAEFLNNYMESATRRFDYDDGLEIFSETFSQLAKAFPSGLRRPHKQSGATSLVLYEAVAVGAALAIEKSGKISTAHLGKWLQSEFLRKNTTGATNNRPAVRARIEFCRDRFLGIPLANRQ